jgi:hypothetical protein
MVVVCSERSVFFSSRIELFLVWNKIVFVFRYLCIHELCTVYTDILILCTYT